MIRVLLVADVRLHREGLAGLLASDGRIRVAATADSHENLARDAEGADVAVIDAAGEDSVGAVKRVAAAASLPIVTLGTPNADDQVIAFAEAGVLGFIDGEASVDDLRSGIECAARGEASCPPRIATTLLQRLAALTGVQRGASEPTGLTRRERQIVQLIAEGMSNKEIARRLCIEVATVKNHVHNILEKLKVSRRSDAVARVRLAEGSNGSASSAPVPRPSMMDPIRIR
jgi:two-component system nitrate/nitrite response regulator NarL